MPPPSIPGTSVPTAIPARTPTAIRVFFDLDYTLIISDRAEKFGFLENFSHLTRVVDAEVGVTYFIFLEQTKELFHWLLANNVKIGFATHSGRNKEQVFSLLIKHYALPNNFFNDAIYLNIYDLAAQNFSKRERLDDLAADLGISREIVFLVDDDRRQFFVEDKLALPVYTIHAQGFSTTKKLAKINQLVINDVTIKDAYLGQIKIQVGACLSHVGSIVVESKSAQLALN